MSAPAEESLCVANGNVKSETSIDELNVLRAIWINRGYFGKSFWASNNTEYYGKGE